MAYPSLGNWNARQPNEAEAGAVAIAEQLAWSAIERLTAGRVAFETTTVRPVTAQADGSILLPPPVGGVAEVRVDGLVVTDWRLDGNLLVDLNDQQWPAGQDLTLSPNVVGTFEVDYWNGWRPGRLLIWAAAELANEFYLAASGSKKCRLPSNVTAITRQGVSFEMQSPLFDAGRTGIHEIDVVIARYNPQGLRAQTIIATPESLALVRRVS